MDIAKSSHKELYTERPKKCGQTNSILYQEYLDADCKVHSNIRFIQRSWKIARLIIFKNRKKNIKKCDLEGQKCGPSSRMDRSN